MGLLRAPPTPQTVVRVADSDFLVQGESWAALPAIEGPEQWIPTTVVNWSTDEATIPKPVAFDDEALEAVVAQFSTRDDVWHPAFLQVIILVTPAQVVVPEIFSRGSRVVQLIACGALREGPYLLHSTDGSIYPAVKLLPDFNNAFVQGVVPRVDDHAAFSWLSGVNGIAVPSKMHRREPSLRRPLEGLRFAVKDSIDIAGLETGCGSASWRQLYPPVSSSAPFIDHLLSAGAILVGKLRCGHLLDAQDPLERFEEVTPTNPRGDGFQKPSGSSSGSGAAIASYEWLDFTVGTDTGGSVRTPAAVSGVYGIRPSLHSVDSDGLTATVLMDTVGVFARDASIMERVMSCISTLPAEDQARTPTESADFRLLCGVDAENWGVSPEWTPVKFFPRDCDPAARGEAMDVFEQFLLNLEQALGTDRHAISLEELWAKTRPDGMSADLGTATETIYQDIVYHELATGVVEDFRKDYRAAHNGREPFIEPLSKVRLAYGASVTKKQYGESIEAFKSYGDWVNDFLLPLSPKEGEEGLPSQEMPLLILPRTWGNPQYRDEVCGPLKEGQIFSGGFSTHSISYCSGCPEVVVPVGDVGFLSKITGQEERLPVAVSILAPKGCDAALLGLLSMLQRKGVVRPVRCGATLYE